MRNVTITTAPGTVTITIKTGKAEISAAPPSASGKTYLLATTGGGAPLDIPGAPGASLALNLMFKKP